MFIVLVVLVVVVFVVVVFVVVVFVVVVVAVVVVVVVVVVERRVLGLGSSRSVKLENEQTKTHLLAGRWVHHLHSLISSSVVVLVASHRRCASLSSGLLIW